MNSATLLAKLWNDTANLGVFWRKDEGLADSDNLPPPAVTARETVEDLEAAPERSRLIAADWGGTSAERTD